MNLQNIRMVEQNSKLFYGKMTEYTNSLKEVFPELVDKITAYMSNSEEEIMSLYVRDVMSKHTVTDDLACPGVILPDIPMTESTWTELSKVTQKAIYDYLSILDLCAMMGGGAEFSKDWAEKVLRDWRGRMSRMDFDGISKKLFGIFGKGSDNLPPLPEKFLKGKLAKLAEEMVKEFRPEDFGLKDSDIESVEKDPTRAFEILMEAAMKNPEMLQKAVQRVAKKLQEKVASGQFKPQDLVAEAEEMIREFKDHPSFVDMMSSFKEAFNFEDPDLARSVGREGENRLSNARNRLRAKLEKKRRGAGGGAAGGAAGATK